mgnify:FL=1
MTLFSKINFSGADVVKLVGFVIVMLSHYYAIKMEIANMKSDREIIEFRLKRLEQINNIAAIMPKEITVPNGKQR